jgi:hypothetical protein
MNRGIMALCIASSFAASGIVAQPSGRSLIDANRLWTSGGSEQSSKVVKDTSVTGAKVIQITSTGKNSKYSANVSYRLTGAYKQGERIVLSGMVKSNDATQISLNVELAEAPYSRVGGGTIEVGTQWTPYKVEFVAPAARVAGTTRAIVQLNSEARTLYFGPLAATAATQN